MARRSVEAENFKEIHSNQVEMMLSIFVEQSTYLTYSLGAIFLLISFILMNTEH